MGKGYGDSFNSVLFRAGHEASAIPFGISRLSADAFPILPQKLIIKDVIELIMLYLP